MDISSTFLATVDSEILTRILSPRSIEVVMEPQDRHFQLGNVCHFPIGILGQVWYLIVSIPDLCTLTYLDWFVCKDTDWY